MCYIQLIVNKDTNKFPSDTTLILKRKSSYMFRHVSKPSSVCTRLCKDKMYNCVGYMQPLLGFLLINKCFRRISIGIFVYVTQRCELREVPVINKSCV
jgi:hypothetical protein